MNRPVTLLSIIAAAWLAAPVAMAGNDIVKCVDPQGRVTLTDQPCESGASATRLVLDAGAPVADAAPAPQRHVLPAAELPRPAAPYPVAERPARPLARDVATLKAARRALMLMDSRPTLAGIQ
jgi:hypothetical protein